MFMNKFPFIYCSQKEGPGDIGSIKVTEILTRAIERHSPKFLPE